MYIETVSKVGSLINLKCSDSPSVSPIPRIAMQCLKGGKSIQGRYRGTEQYSVSHHLANKNIV